MAARHEAQHRARHRSQNAAVTRGSQPDWSLRLGLGLLLVALVIAALLASTILPRPRVVLAATGSDRRDPATGLDRPGPIAARPGPTRRVTSSSAPSPTTTASRVPGQRRRVGHSCGLSLGTSVAPRPVRRCTVLEVGDSLGNDLGWGLSRHLQPSSGLNLVQADESSTGLVNTSYWNWPSHLATDLREDHPQLVLISLGGNDEQGMIVNGSAVEFPTPAWQAAYLARARQLAREATSSGAYVLWVGMPIMQQPEFSAGMQVLNTLYQRAVSSDPDAVFLPVWPLFANPQGQFQSDAAVDGSATALREPDGVHYSYAGEDVIATYVLQRMAATFHVRLTPSDPAVITGWG
jgi:lysophospholipase L1-like esterase